MAINLNEMFGTVGQFFETDSRNIGFHGATDSENGYTTTYNEIPTPAWIPDSYMRSIKRNIYHNMINNASYYGIKTTPNSANNGKTLDFYQESDSNILIDGLTKAVKSVVSVGANQVMSLTNTLDSAINGVTSLFGGRGGNNDIVGSFRSFSNNPFLAAQPYVKIRGIHVTESMRENVEILNKILNDIKVLLGPDVNKDDSSIWNEIKDFTDKTKDVLFELGKKYIFYGCEGNDFKELITNAMTDPYKRLHGFAEIMLTNLISGTYTASCKLPYITNKGTVFSSGDPNNAWRTPFSRHGSSKNNNIVDTLFNSIETLSGGLYPVWTQNITWDGKTGVLNPQDNITLHFDIYNDTLEHTLMNLAFIWGFGSKTQPVTDTFFLRAPYLFDIEVPCTIRLKLCSCDFTVTTKGKLRKWTSVNKETNKIFEELLSKIFGFKNINMAAIEYVPDIYNINITFKPLIPKVWSIADTYIHDVDNKIPEIGTHIRTYLANCILGGVDKK